jgi:DeoR family transcriptional regulator, aga operon transcriptional repressor
VRQAERFGRILERMAGNGTVSVVEIAADLEVSAATIRRDLRVLEAQRLLARTHGGAVAQGVLYELPLRYKSARYQQEKVRIAREAASRVHDGMAIGLTGGTTTTEVARTISDRRQLTVVTNALNIASELAIRPNLKLVVTGGVARSKSYELVGPMAEACLGALNLDIAFVGVDGIDPEGGLTTHHEIEAHTNGSLIGRARRVVVVADASKIGRVAFARICEVSRVHEMITDTHADPSVLARLADAGVEVSTV